MRAPLCRTQQRPSAAALAQVVAAARRTLHALTTLLEHHAPLTAQGALAQQHLQPAGPASLTPPSQQQQQRWRQRGPGGSAVHGAAARLCGLAAEAALRPRLEDFDVVLLLRKEALPRVRAGVGVDASKGWGVLHWDAHACSCVAWASRLGRVWWCICRGCHIAPQLADV